ncbi:hypothetical protein Tco_0389982 [Tanacetum coccineum]
MLLNDSDWVEAMQEEMQQFINQKVWKLVLLPDGKTAIGTKWILKNKRDTKGIVVRIKPYWIASFKRSSDGIFISHDKYVQDMLKKFDLEKCYGTATTTYEASSINPRMKPNDFKKIFKYLKGQPKLGLWLQLLSVVVRYALTHDPIIFDSLVKQFWSTASLRAPELGPPAILATIDRTPYSITEGIVRSQLQLGDDGGIEDLPIADIYLDIPQTIPETIQENIPEPDQSQEQLPTPPRPTTSDQIPPVFEQGHTSDPNIASFSGAYELIITFFLYKLEKMNETLGGSFYTTLPRSTQVPPLVKKVKALEWKLKTRSRKVVMSESDKEEEEEQDMDPLIKLAKAAAASDAHVDVSPGADIPPSPPLPTDMSAGVSSGVSTGAPTGPSTVSPVVVLHCHSFITLSDERQKEKGKERRERPMTPSQLRQYMHTYVKNQGPAVYSTGWTMAQVHMTSASSKKLKTGDDEVTVEAPSHGVPQEEKGATPSQNVSPEEVTAPSHCARIFTYASS